MTIYESSHHFLLFFSGAFLHPRCGIDNVHLTVTHLLIQYTWCINSSSEDTELFKLRLTDVAFPCLHHVYKSRVKWPSAVKRFLLRCFLLSLVLPDPSVTNLFPLLLHKSHNMRGRLLVTHTIFSPSLKSMLYMLWGELNSEWIVKAVCHSTAHPR